MVTLAHLIHPKNTANQSNINGNGRSRVANTQQWKHEQSSTTTIAPTIWLSFGTATYSTHRSHISWSRLVFHAPKKTINFKCGSFNQAGEQAGRQTYKNLHTFCVRVLESVEQSFWNICNDQTHSEPLRLIITREKKRSKRFIVRKVLAKGHTFSVNKTVAGSCQSFEYRMYFVVWKRTL